MKAGKAKTADLKSPAGSISQSKAQAKLEISAVVDSATEEGIEDNGNPDINAKALDKGMSPLTSNVRDAESQTANPKTMGNDASQIVSTAHPNVNIESTAKIENNRILASPTVRETACTESERASTSCDKDEGSRIKDHLKEEHCVENCCCEGNICKLIPGKDCTINIKDEILEESIAGQKPMDDHSQKAR